MTAGLLLSVEKPAVIDRRYSASGLLFLSFLVGGFRFAFLFALFLAFLGVFLCFRLLRFALLRFFFLFGGRRAFLRFGFTFFLGEGGHGHADHHYECQHKSQHSLHAFLL